jgi:hypothetical protein
MPNPGQGNRCFSGNDLDTITYGKTDPSAFLHIADGTTDAKSVCGNDPFKSVSQIIYHAALNHSIPCMKHKH